MNRKELEKLFDEKFNLGTLTICMKCNCKGYNLPGWKGCGNCGSLNTYNTIEGEFNNNIIKSFIFDTVIKEVLESIKLKELPDYKQENIGWNIASSEIKDRAKSLYGIIL